MFICGPVFTHRLFEVFPLNAEAQGDMQHVSQDSVSGYQRLSQPRRVCELPPAAVFQGRETANLFGVSFKNVAARRCSVCVSQSCVEVAVRRRVSARQAPGRDRSVAFRTPSTRLLQLLDLSRVTHRNVQSFSSGSRFVFQLSLEVAGAGCCELQWLPQTRGESLLVD